jgi:beta-lactam-binding protein with PASTA domain
MPNLVGMDPAQVNAALHTAGLFYKTQGPGAGIPAAWTKVVSTIPAAGVTVPYMSTVTLNVTK